MITQRTILIIFFALLAIIIGVVFWAGYQKGSATQPQINHHENSHRLDSVPADSLHSIINSIVPD